MFVDVIGYALDIRGKPHRREIESRFVQPLLEIIKRRIESLLDIRFRHRVGQGSDGLRPVVVGQIHIQHIFEIQSYGIAAGQGSAQAEAFPQGGENRCMVERIRRAVMRKIPILDGAQYRSRPDVWGD